MRLKKNKNTKSITKNFRVNHKELNKMKLKANVYCEGNLSEWIIYAAINHRPKGSDLEK